MSDYLTESFVILFLIESLFLFQDTIYGEDKSWNTINIYTLDGGLFASQTPPHQSQQIHMWLGESGSSFSFLTHVGIYKHGWYMLPMPFYKERISKWCIKFMSLTLLSPSSLPLVWEKSSMDISQSTSNSLNF